MTYLAPVRSAAEPLIVREPQTAKLATSIFLARAAVAINESRR